MSYNCFKGRKLCFPWLYRLTSRVRRRERCQRKSRGLEGILVLLLTNWVTWSESLCLSEPQSFHLLLGWMLAQVRVLHNVPSHSADLYLTWNTHICLSPLQKWYHAKPWRGPWDKGDSPVVQRDYKAPQETLTWKSFLSVVIFSKNIKEYKRISFFPKNWKAKPRSSISRGELSGKEEKLSLTCSDLQRAFYLVPSRYKEKQVGEGSTAGPPYFTKSLLTSLVKVDQANCTPRYCRNQ